MRRLDGITDSMDVSVSKLRDMVRDGEAWRTAVLGVPKSQTRLSDRTTTKNLAVQIFNWVPCISVR